MASKTLTCVLLLPILLLQIHLSAAVKGGYWFPEAGMPASAIESSLFTHLFCAFAQLDTQTNQLVIPQENRAAFAQFTSTVRQKNPSVKTLLSIGGGSIPSATFAAMARQPASRRTFIDSSIRLARANGFHGLDMDWEHQTQASEMADLGTLLRELRTAVDNEQRGTNVSKLLLTAALGFSSRMDGVDYPAASLAQCLDWINVMAYDMAAPTRSDVTRSHAALNDPSGTQGSGSAGIRSWIQAGVPANKLALGFPFYGYSYRLADPARNGLLAPATGIDSSIPGVDPNEGTIGYNLIRQFITNRSARTVFNSSFVTDYAYSGSTWIGYDDLQTIVTKVNYAKQNRLGGYFAWHVGADNNWDLSRRASQTWGA